MGKDRRSFTIDDDLSEQLQSKDSLNASAVVNELLRQYLAHGEAADAGLQMRLKDIDSEIEDKQREISRMESAIERLEREREDLRRQIEQRRNEGMEEVETMAKKIREGLFPEDNLTLDNPAIKNSAQKASITPERFVSLVEERL